MSDFTNINPLWRLADPLTVKQAAVLIAGFDPNKVSFRADGSAYFHSENDDTSIVWVDTAFAALTNAINGGNLKAKINYPAEPQFLVWGTNPNYDSSFLHGAVEVRTEKNNFAVFPEPNFDRTLIEVIELKRWLKSSGIQDGFFFPDSTNAPDYLDPKNTRYAPKLAAAVNAWIAVTDPGKVSPKKALEKWLRENAARFGMTDDDGNPINQAIDDCSKVANWQPGGGAPKTP
jgi:hypothetical protein